MKRPSRTATRIATAGTAVALALVSLLPSGQGRLAGWDAALSPSLQNLLHVPAYAVLTVLAALAASSAPRAGAGLLIGAALACSVFGAALEYFQTIIPGRTGSAMDAGLNAVGAAVGAVVVAVWQRGCPRRRRDAATSGTTKERLRAR